MPAAVTMQGNEKKLLCVVGSSSTYLKTSLAKLTNQESLLYFILQTQVDKVYVQTIKLYWESQEESSRVKYTYLN